jgi:cyclophilin family peptidyl-prolyl cis-trans isomerase
MKRLILLLLFLPALVLAQPERGAAPKKKDYLVTLTTDFGTIRLIFFPNTPLHRDNYIKLIDKHFFDGLLFHRIIEGFMIQGGDPVSRTAKPGQALGDGDNGTLIPAEIRPDRFHYKGVVAAARDNRPDKASSDTQFYIVQGRVWTDSTLAQQIAKGQSRGGRLPTDAQKQVYKTIGGTPHLDGNYTVFGEVIDGLSVVDSIAKQPRAQADRPIKDIRMTVSGEWVKKKQLKKRYGYNYSMP